MRNNVILERGRVAGGCRHCGRHPVTRPRGLCWTCYYTSGIRGRYPSVSRYGRRGIDDYYGWSPVPPTPTLAPPGSAEKVEVLAERARRHQALWHPRDAPLDLARLVAQCQLRDTA